jgi:DNA-binding protein HU-beta
MNRKELVTIAAKKTGCSKTVVAGMLECFIEAIESADSVDLRPFGQFKRVEKAARTCRNPQTGGTVNVPAKTVLVFRASKVKG